ncbi:MAG TPA: glycosyl hydrolase [Acidobacteriaceae bacterium]|nr:glycosyl hydrolase [Acidobacteriaceae bacterium]
MQSTRLSIIFASALLAAGVTWAGSTRPASTATSAKKGIGEWGQPHATPTLVDARVAWYYDWQPRSDIRNPPAGIQFIPMIWGGKNLNPRDEADAQKTGAGILLTFNEPDNPGQSHMTVAEALAAWPQLQALGMTLGSPAVAEDPTKPNGWLAQFMAGAKTSGYRVDFICVHAYQADFNPEAATQHLVKTLQTVHSMYHLPIWLTEYAMGSWPGTTTLTPDFATQATFARVSAPALESLPFLQRYAWYVDAPNQRTWSAYKSDGTETVVGAAWKSAPSRKPR